MDNFFFFKVQAPYKLNETCHLPRHQFVTTGTECQHLVVDLVVHAFEPSLSYLGSMTAVPKAFYTLEPPGTLTHPMPRSRTIPIIPECSGVGARLRMF